MLGTKMSAGLNAGPIHLRAVAVAKTDSAFAKNFATFINIKDLPSRGGYAQSISKMDQILKS